MSKQINQNIERSRRSRGELVFKRIVASAEIKQWGSFLSSNENKNSLVTFIVSEWKKREYRSKILHKDVCNRWKQDIHN